MTSTSRIEPVGGSFSFFPKGERVVTEKLALMKLCGDGEGGGGAEGTIAPGKAAGIAGKTRGDGAVWTQYSKFVDVDTFFASFVGFFVANVSSLVDFVDVNRSVLQRNHHTVTVTSFCVGYVLLKS